MTPVLAPDEAGQPLLVGELDGGELVAEALVLGMPAAERPPAGRDPTRQSGPMRESISRASPGLAWFNQRRGVTPVGSC